MKRKCINCGRLLLTVVLLWICGAMAMANPQEVVKTKSINRTFQLEANDELEVDNKYGEITVAHWERNEVLIQVEIESRAASEKVAQANLDRITIEMNQWGHGIKAETVIASNKGNWSHGSASFSTRYLIKMPASLKTELSQKYGNINLPRSNNHDMEVSVKYGNLSAGDFVGRLELEAKYGNVAVGNLTKASMELGYAGSVRIGDADQLDIEIKYSNLKVQKVNSLQLNSGYSDLSAEQIGKALIEMRYGNAKIKSLEQSLEAETFSYSNLTVNRLDEHFKLLAVEARFSNVRASIAAGASFNVDAEEMKYGTCKLRGLNLTKHEKSDEAVHAQVNGGNHGWIRFEGGGHSNLSVSAL